MAWIGRGPQSTCWGHNPGIHSGAWSGARVVPIAWLLAWWGPGCLLWDGCPTSLSSGPLYGAWSMPRTTSPREEAWSQVHWRSKHLGLLGVSSKCSFRLARQKQVSELGLVGPPCHVVDGSSPVAQGCQEGALRKLASAKHSLKTSICWHQDSWNSSNHPHHPQSTISPLSLEWGASMTWYRHPRPNRFSQGRAMPPVPCWHMTSPRLRAHPALCRTHLTPVLTFLRLTTGRSLSFGASISCSISSSSSTASVSTSNSPDDIPSAIPGSSQSARKKKGRALPKPSLCWFRIWLQWCRALLLLQARSQLRPSYNVN